MAIVGVKMQCSIEVGSSPSDCFFKIQREKPPTREKDDASFFFMFLKVDDDDTGVS